MKSTARGPDLAYDLFATPDRSSIWGSGGDGAPITETFSAGLPTTIYIYARMPAQQHAASGRYDDEIEVMTIP